MLLWKRIDKFYQPKTIQNQIAYSSRISYNFLHKEKLEEALNELSENTGTLCRLIKDNIVTPSSLLDLAVAMCTIISLPDYYKTMGELWLKKCNIGETNPSLNETIEETRLYIKRTKENAKNAKALATKLNKEKTKTLG
ncbi:hypothetical protein O181_027423 [Austropuccinia psidii MF-1]|uniref:Uncharacterized protein n=1 Tax=Austropuccinia psidii MF-1 TaxID=1389203 RepID=A0A9Q3CRT3_9BASI|nr:hypothetical protein [Austropuccinia psidii MF-1]